MFVKSECDSGTQICYDPACDYWKQLILLTENSVLGAGVFQRRICIQFSEEFKKG